MWNGTVDSVEELSDPLADSQKENGGPQSFSCREPNLVNNRELGRGPGFQSGTQPGPHRDSSLWDPEQRT